MEESDRYEHSRLNMITERSTTAKRKKLYKEVSFLKGALQLHPFLAKVPKKCWPWLQKPTTSMRSLHRNVDVKSGEVSKVYFNKAFTVGFVGIEDDDDDDDHSGRGVVVMQLLRI